MAATVSYTAALAGQPVEVAEKFLSDPNRWKVTVAGKVQPIGTDVVIEGRFGSIKTAVVMNADGTPSFDKPIVYEAPATNIVAWGIGKDGKARIGVIRQPRPHADDPLNQWKDGHAPVVIGQLPMGYLDKLAGGKFETPEAGAVREVGEETGATAVLNVERPKCPWHNPNPTFVGSWTDLLFVKVDLDKVEALKADHSEPIYSAEYIPVPELLRRIREGRDAESAYYRMATANSLWFVFFATHPELWEV
ncbi:MAG: NUDIX domain-containing protein [Patescibacteria group bacterium]